MNFIRKLAGSALFAGLLLGAGCELITAPDRTLIGTGGGGTGGSPTTTVGGGGTGGSVCTPVDDSKECTDDVCENDVPVNNPKAIGEACTDGGAVCDGKGACVECNVAADCNDNTETCMGNACVPVTCTDNELNGDESDEDCGGSCPPCADGKNCGDGTDCANDICEAGKCKPAACDDTFENGDETDVDCGGPTCATKCDDGLKCDDATDCKSGVCAVEGTCSAPVCGDNVINGTEICDDGNNIDDDGCDANCTLTGCGNGVVAGTELCDDGNNTIGDGCDDGPTGNCTPSGCGNGIITGAEVCDDGNKANDDGCDDAAGANCTPTGCGNGVVTGSEICDDGNATNGDGCDDAAGANCTVTACGNGIITGTEVCDDGNQANGDGCDDAAGANCTVSACGNGVVAGTEACDDGNATEGDGCDTNCTVTACGNGVVTGTEVCDDGNATNGDGCDDGPGGNCTATECGNGVTTGTEACDDGNATDGDGCDVNCTISGCGNGVVTGTEACDDGNMVQGDGCDNNCTVTACGNGVTTGTEACDDGNQTNGDGCDNNCKVTACGNGIITGTEACDDSNVIGGDGCSATCTIENLESEPNGTCGTTDGPFTPNPSVNVISVISPANDQDFFSFTLPGPGVQSIKVETFKGVVPGACDTSVDTEMELLAQNCSTVLATDDDDGLGFCSLIDPTGADTGARKLAPGTYFVHAFEHGNDGTIANYNVTVTIVSTCGNNTVEPTEACDDGNLTNGDTCDQNCTVPACGNGVKVAAEGCDDGNTTNGDGCSSTCTVEAGYNCTGTVPSVCQGVCGDGVIQSNESCDDGNATAGDCCSATCQLEQCETEVNNTCGAEDPMPAFTLSPKRAVAGGAITPVGDLDIYSFVLTKPATVKVETFTGKPGQCTGDTLIELRGTNCNTVIISDDDDGVNACSLIDPTVAADAAARNLAAGTYFVRVNEFGNDATIASYGVTVTLVDECGNGTKGAFEGCDDGNNTAGDGCSPTCAVESGFNCTGTTPSVCTAICGNGLKQGAEGCDDNNTANGDGCSSTCTVESGFSCVGEGAGSCSPICGDGQLKGSEACDDNNIVANDGCSSTCAIEPGFTCVGAPSVCTATASCKALHTAQPLLVDGDYAIDSDGPGGNSPFVVRCDMTTSGGGWTLAFNDGTGFDKTLNGSGAQTGYTTNFINLAYSTVAITADVMIDASDTAMNAENQELRSVIAGLPAGSLNKTLRDLLNTQAGPNFFDAEDNSNVTNTFAGGFTCMTIGKWTDYAGLMCGTDVLVGNDPTGASAFAFGIDTSYSVTLVNGAGWPQDPNFMGTNFWPDNFRVWVR